MNKKNIILIILVLIVAVVAVTLTILRNDEKKLADVNNEDIKLKEAIIYEGIKIIPGEEFKENTIQEEANYSEITSCAFEGNDKIYTYKGIEITLALIDGTYKVYEIYCINDMAETQEGIKITDSKSAMIEAYGTNYEEEFGNKYTYNEENIKKSFIIENDIITSIVYTVEFMK